MVQQENIGTSPDQWADWSAAEVLLLYCSIPGLLGVWVVRMDRRVGFSLHLATRITGNGHTGRLAHLVAAAASFRHLLRAACFREELCARASVTLFARASSLASLPIY